MNKDVAQLLAEARRQGFRDQAFKRGHYVINPVTGAEISVYSDSSNRYLVPRFRRDLRRIGFHDPHQPPKKKQLRSELGSTSPQPPKEAKQMTAHTPAPSTDPEESAIRSCNEIVADTETAVWAIAQRIREMATERDVAMKVKGAPRKGCKWSGDFKGQVLFFLWPELHALPGRRMEKLVEALVGAMDAAGVDVVHQNQGRGSVWFVPDEQEDQSKPEAAPASREPAFEAQPVPEPRKSAVEASAKGGARGWPCTEPGCLYVADSEQARFSHHSRTVGDHSQYRQEGAPFRCADLLAVLTKGRETCVMEAGTADSVINHARRRHAALIRNVQICRECLSPLPKGKRALLDHVAREHDNRSTSPVPRRAPVPPPAAPPKPAAQIVTRKPPEPAAAIPAAALAPNGKFDPAAAVEAFMGMVEQYRSALEDNARLRQENTELREKAEQHAASLEVDVQELDRLREENAQLRKEAKAFEQIRSGMAALAQLNQ